MKISNGVNLKDLKIDLPGNWREVSRVGAENSISLRIYHINPLTRVDPNIQQDRSLPSSDPNVSITKVGIPTFSYPFEDFYKGMKGFIESGFAPPHMTFEWLEKFWKQLTETPMGERPGESDWAGEITIAKYPSEEIARQSFKNMALMPTQGFNVPIPGGVKLPGLPENVSFTELLESDVYKKYLKENIPEEQLKQIGGLSGLEKQLERTRVEIEKVQKQVQEEVKPSLEKSGVKYKEGKYLGGEAIYVESKNPTPPPKPKLSSRKTSEGGGGGYIWSMDPLPKIFCPYQKTLIFYQALLVKTFIISGSLLWTVAFFPPGNAPCYSLTQSKKKTTTTREGGEIFTDITIVPLVSNYAKEGYLHKEEVEQIFKRIIAALK